MQPPNDQMKPPDLELQKELSSLQSKAQSECEESFSCWIQFPHLVLILGSAPSTLSARTQQTFWNLKGLTPTSHLEITPKHAGTRKYWVSPTAQPCKPIVNFPLPTLALSAPLTYLLRALLAIFTP